MEYAANEIQNMEYEHEKGNTGHSPYIESGTWDTKMTQFWNVRRGKI